MLDLVVGRIGSIFCIPRQPKPFSFSKQSKTRIRVEDNEPTSKPPYLPPELTDIIVEFLHKDKRSLANCSLVCHCWLPRASALLFRNLKLSIDHNTPPETILTFDTLSLFLLHSPRVGAHIQRLELKSNYTYNYCIYSVLHMDTLMEIVGRLPRLRVLVLDVATIQHNHYADQTTRIHLEELTIYCDKRRIYSVFQIIPLFALLDSLTIIGDVGDRNHQGTGTPFKVQRRAPVRSLMILTDDCREASLFLGELREILDPQALQELHLGVRKGVEITSLNRFLLDFGPSIRTFQSSGWAPLLSPDSFSFSQCTHLEHVNIALEAVIRSYSLIATERWSECLRALCTIPLSTRFISIKLGIWVSPTIMDVSVDEALKALKLLDWADLDNIAKHCQGLERLELKVLPMSGCLEKLSSDDIKRMVTAHISPLRHNVLHVKMD